MLFRGVRKTDTPERVPYYEAQDGGGHAVGMGNKRGSLLTLVLSLVVVAGVMVMGAAAGYLLPKRPVYTYSVSIPMGSSTVELVEGSWPALANTDFFRQVEARFIEERMSFVVANLSTMELRVYEDGAQVLTVPIKSKGREGSWWETPAGLYRAEAKKETHFSSFGQVHLPWSIPFQGNFFIHGWPVYPDGTPVASTYSGGCIRLEDDYAKQVYEHTEVGMPILVYKEEFSPDTFRYTLRSPEIDARGYLVADLKNNFMLVSRDARGRYPSPATAKLMAALVATEHKNIEAHIVLTHETSLAEAIGFAPGGSYTLYDTLFPLLLSNSATSARAIADTFGAARFVGLMNDKARALGMQDTVYRDAAGTQSESVTTAEDLYQLARYLLNNRPFILAITAGTLDLRFYGKPAWEARAPSHPLSGREGFVGGVANRYATTTVPLEQGTEELPRAQGAAVMLAFATSTAALPDGAPRHDMLSILELPFGTASRPVLVAVLDSRYPHEDTATLIEYVRGMYR